MHQNFRFFRYHGNGSDRIQNIFSDYDTPCLDGHLGVLYDIVGYFFGYEKAQKPRKTRKNADLGNFSRFHGNNKIFLGLVESANLEGNTWTNFIAKISKILRSNFAGRKVPQICCFKVRALPTTFGLIFFNIIHSVHYVARIISILMYRKGNTSRGTRSVIANKSLRWSIVAQFVIMRFTC